MNKNKDEERGEGIRVKGRVSWLSKMIKYKSTNYSNYKIVIYSQNKCLVCRKNKLSRDSKRVPFTT